MPVSIPTADDVPALVALINGAYRGDASKKGWTTEADLLEGEARTDAPTLTELMNDEHAVLLKHHSETGEITGCVYLQQQENGLYLGMLTVSPVLQGAGIGKLLLKAADEYAVKTNCPSVFMNVISLRKELIDWYQRYGYSDTGERKPFPSDKRFGAPRQPLEIMILRKEIKNAISI